MAQKVIVGVEFVDTSQSVAKLAKTLQSSVANSGLSDSVKAQTAKVVADLEAYSQKVSKLQIGGKIDPKAFNQIFAQSKLAQKSVSNLVKEINDEMKNLDLAPEVKAQMAAIDNSIAQSTAKINNEQKKIEELQNLPAKSKVKGFGTFTDIDLILKKYDEYADKIQKLKRNSEEEPANVVQNDKEIADLEARNKAMEPTIALIKQRKQAQQESLTVIAQENSLIQMLTNTLVNLTRDSKGNPVVDPEKIQEIISISQQWDAQNRQTAEGVKKQVREHQEAAGALGGFTQNVQNSIKNLFGYAAVFSFVRRTVKESIRAVKELDKSFTEIAMVTTMTRNEVWKMKDSMYELSKATGLTINDIAKLSAEFYKQGRSIEETTNLVEAAGIAAKLAGISTSDSVNYLTSAINGYKLSASQAMVISDKFAALAASSATDYEELAIALSKVAAQAYSTGVNMDNMMGFIAKALETTREAPENIGTAFKTIFARMSEIKDYGTTLEDGMDVNRVAKALNTIGVSLTDQNNQIRNLDDVLIEVGYQWKNLDKNQKAYIATTLAGTRQQTRLLAVMEDFDRTMELSQISANSLGASYGQMAKYYESIEYAMERMSSAWQQFITDVANSDVIITVVNIITSGIEALDNQVVITIGVFTALAFAIKAVFALEAIDKIKTFYSAIKDGTIFAKTLNTVLEFLNIRKKEDAEVTTKQSLATDVNTKANYANATSITAQTTQTDLNTTSNYANATSIDAQTEAIVRRNMAEAGGIDIPIPKNVVSDVADEVVDSLDNMGMWAEAADNTINGTSAALIEMTIAAEATAPAVEAGTEALVSIEGAGGAATGVISKLVTAITGLGGVAVGVGVAIAAVAAALIYLNYKAHQANGTLENLEKTSRDYNATIYNTDKKVQDIQKVIEQYKELAKQINRTTDEETQLQEYAKQIQDTLGDEYTVINFKGELDLTAVESAIQKLTSSTEEEFNTMVDNIDKGLNRMAYAFEDLDAGSKYAKNLKTAMELANAATREAFNELSATEQSYYLAQANAENEAKNAKKVIATTAKNWIVTGTDANGYSTGKWEEIAVQKVEIVPELNDSEIAKLNTQLSQEVFNTWSGSNAYNKATELVNLGYDQMEDAEKNYVNNMLEGAQTIDKINQLFADDTVKRDQILQTLGNNLDLYDELVTKLESLNLTETAEKTLIGDIISGGAANAFNKFITSIDAAKMSLGEVLSVAKQLNDLEFANIDTVAQLGSLEGMTKSLEDAQKMLAGTSTFNIKQLKDILSTYPEIATAIMDNGELSDQEIRDAMALENEKAKNELKNEQIYYQNQIDLAEFEIGLLEEMAGNEVYLQSKTVETMRDLAAQGLEAQLIDYQTFTNAKTKTELQQFGIIVEAGKIALQNLFTGKGWDWQAAYNQAVSNNSEAITDFKNALASATTIDAEKEATTAKEVIEQQIKGLRDKVASYKAMIAIDQKAIDGIDAGTLFKEATDAATTYEAKLNGIYVIEQALVAINDELSKFKFEEEHAKTGEEWVTAIYSQNAALESQNKLLDDLTNAQKSAQSSILNGVSSISKAYKIINGRMVPVMSEYIKLSDTEKEALDNATESFNEYSDSINSNTQQLQENSAAITDNLQAIEDKTVELYDLIKEAIIAEEDKKLKILQDGLEEEKKILDKRRQMYEDAFAEEDYTNDLADLEAQRISIIEQLASLEGATDLASNRKRADLLDQKASLDEEYNQSVTEYNRDALLQTIDDQQAALDETSAAYQNAYDQRIADTQWMEDQVQLIVNSGLDATIAYLQANLPAYTEAWSIEKDNITEGWTLLYEQVTTTVDAIEQNIPDFSEMISQLTEAYRLTQQIANAPVTQTTTKTATPVVTTKTATPVVTTTTTTATKKYNTYGCPDPLTPIKVSPYSSVQAGLLKVGDIIYTMHEHTKEFGYYKVSYAETYKQPKLKFTFDDESETIFSESHRFYIGDDSWKFAKNLKINDTVIGLKYNKTIINIESVGEGDVVKFEIEEAHTYIADDLISHNVKASFEGYSEGGVADYTGLAMLHGSVSKPERILSPLQTELFDNLVSSLETTRSNSYTSANSNISIENITIQTPQLNTNADFASAGKTLAMELKTAIAERGININKKR